ncbi:COL12A [Mytilus edulis]|uniref:COL12A n=1 Tax=Mytilus edulis TaxID=6550 RepID=A0A8S3TVW8_MYTED|nr:COL12A [Mytilus edulis]
MTIEWDITDSDNYLEYKIVDPLKGPDDWEQKLLSAKDVVVKENESCVYVLYSLSPDTSYELKMCYIDKNQVKSKYTESQTHRTLKAAPKNLDIIERTESSLTIKWDKDDPDKRRAYKLNYRHKTSEKWIVKELSTENIKTNEDGCHVYKLNKLLPETLYELRICSLDNQQLRKNLDIIERTESSLTIKWDKDDSVKRRAYQLDYRHKTSEKWIVKELSTENIKTNEDGCHVYTLQELLPEILYELRLCSLDNQQVCSQYTESKLPKTQQIAPKNLDIKERTESSLTIKWDKDDSDKRRAYKLDYRHKTSKKWIVKELSTENIKTNEEGCHVYTLQELLPETLYELRLCSWIINRTAVNILSLSCLRHYKSVNEFFICLLA